MASTFNSIELRNQATRIRTQVNDIRRTGLGQVYEFGNQISGIVKSEDSTLASEWAAVAEAAKIAGEKIQSYGDFIANSLDKYAGETIENEELAAASTKKASEEIKSTISSLENL